MVDHSQTAQATRSLEYLSRFIPTRAVGSQGNRAAVEFFAGTIASFGFAVETQDFDCMDWSTQGAQLTAGGERHTVQASPYSLGCRATAPLEGAATIDGLADIKPGNKILLVSGASRQRATDAQEFSLLQPG